jgi:hypothetical protein
MFKAWHGDLRRPLRLVRRFPAQTGRAFLRKLTG